MAPSQVQPERRLTVVCSAGLCNRLKVLLSGLALAEASGRSFTMLWPLGRACSAPFSSLFTNPWDVRDVSRAESEALSPHPEFQRTDLWDLLDDPSSELLVEHVDWLVAPRRYAAHAALERRCQELMDELVPVPALSAEVVRFSATHFRPTMIGVHLRRGDFIRARPDLAGNTQTALNHVRSLLATELDAGILVCTDDGAPDPWTRKVTHEGVLSTFQKALGDRVVSRPPRSLDRTSPAAIQDALVDLLLLRKTNMFVGTQSSTFSELAIYGRDVTSVWCGAPRQEYVRLERLARLTGIYFVLQGAGWLRYGHRLPLHTLLRRFFLAPLGRIKRAVWRT